MSMPETTVNEYRLATRREDKVWTTGQAPVMQPVAKAHGMDHAPDEHLRLGVP